MFAHQVFVADRVKGLRRIATKNAGRIRLSRGCHRERLVRWLAGRFWWELTAFVSAPADQPLPRLLVVLDYGAVVVGQAHAYGFFLADELR
jgi:hypothetical protein